ncbi:MAG: YIP1 family protein, partial [Lysinibacillus sp.]
MTAQQPSIDDRQPILSIVTEPRSTIRYALDHKDFSYSLYVGAIGGFASALASLAGTPYQAKYSLGEMVYSSFVTGILYFMLSNLVVAFLLSTIGSALKGKGTFKSLFQAMCLTMIPYIWILPIILFWMQLSPSTFFRIEGASWTMGEAILSFTGMFILLMAAVWVFILTIIAVSEVHGFSKWRAFFTLLLASLVGGVLFGIAMVFF